MTVTLATTRTAWTRHCSPCPRVAGSASGKETWDLEGPGPEMLEGCDIAHMTEAGFRRPGWLLLRVKVLLVALGRLGAEVRAFCSHQVCVLYAVWGRLPWLPL